MDKFLKNKPDIIAWLDKYNITGYKLISDDKYGYTANIDNRVDLGSKDLSFIPIKFGIVKEIFFCNNNNLTSLEFCPHTIGGDFYCDNNNLTSLKYCPTNGVYGFYCSSNKLTSLEFCPKIINSNFDCGYNKLISLEGCPDAINGYFDCNHNKLTNLTHFPSHIGEDTYIGKNNLIGIKDKFYSFEEIYQMHIEHRINAEKKMLENSLNKTNNYDYKKIFNHNSNKLKI